MPELQGRQFGTWYHGSAEHTLVPGRDQILPSKTLGHSNYDYDSDWDEEEDGSNRGEWSFAADTEQEAHEWVPYAPSGRPTVYKVRPAEGVPSRTDSDFLVHESANKHLMAHGPMDIVDRIDIPPPRRSGEVVQGTLPLVNWDADYVRQGTYLEADDAMEDTGNAVYHHPDTARSFRKYEERIAVDQDKVNAHWREQDWLRAGQQRFPGLED